MIFMFEKLLNLAEGALIKILRKSKLKPKDIDYIITVSCTGIMIPSLDAYLINQLKNETGYCTIACY